MRDKPALQGAARSTSGAAGSWSPSIPEHEPDVPVLRAANAAHTILARGMQLRAEGQDTIDVSIGCQPGSA